MGVCGNPWISEENGLGEKDWAFSGKGQLPRSAARHPLNYVFFLPPLFCQRIPAFWTQNLGQNRLKMAKIQLEFDSKID